MYISIPKIATSKTSTNTNIFRWGFTANLWNTPLTKVKEGKHLYWCVFYRQAIWKRKHRINRLLYYATFSAFSVIQMNECGMASWWRTVYIHPAVSGVSVQSSRQMWNHICWQILIAALRCSETRNGRYRIQINFNSVHCIGDKLSITTHNYYTRL